MTGPRCFKLARPVMRTCPRIRCIDDYSQHWLVHQHPWFSHEAISYMLQSSSQTWHVDVNCYLSKIVSRYSCVRRLVPSRSRVTRLSIRTPFLIRWAAVIALSIGLFAWLVPSPPPKLGPRRGMASDVTVIFYFIFGLVHLADMYILMIK